MLELSADVNSEVQRLCAVGDACANKGQFGEALRSYWSAWDLLPEPKTDWETATWILAAAGDANFLDGDFSAARDNLSQAMHCPGGVGNPFLHLRLGQSQLELAVDDRAADELMRAYMGAGAEIFKDQDPKYLRFLQSKARGIEPPPKALQFWK
jgi:hypothetical protein